MIYGEIVLQRTFPTKLIQFVSYILFYASTYLRPRDGEIITSRVTRAQLRKAPRADKKKKRAR